MGDELFEKAPIHKVYFKLALPVVFSMVISLVYNMVDTWFVASTQNTSLVAGVSICAPLFTLMIAVGDIFGIGGSSVISRLFGQKNNTKAKKVSAYCFYVSLIVGILTSILLLLFKEPILLLLGAKEDIWEYASSYYMWLALGAPAIIFSIVPGNILRTEGLAKESMIGSVLGAILNIILDPILIWGFHMGAGGAALATVLSNIAADLALVYLMRKKSQKLSMAISDIQIERQDFKDILFIGIPASVTNIMQSFGIMLLNRNLLPYGTEKIAALGIVLKVNMIVALVMVGFAFGAQPLLGYNYGAGNKERLKKIIKFDILVQLIFSICMVALFFIFASPVIQIFMKDENVIEAGALILRCIMITTPCMSFILVFTTFFQAAGKAFPAFILAISRQGIALLFCMMVLSGLFGYYGVICAQPAADIITMIIALCFAKKYT